MSTKLVVGNGNQIRSGGQSLPPQHLNSLDDLDKVDLVIRSALLKELLAEVVAVGRVAERLCRIKDDAHEELGERHGAWLAEAALEMV